MLDDYRTAPIDERFRATLAFIQKMTLTPDELTAADVPANVSKQALADALYVSTYFNLITRLADSFGFVPISEVLGKDGLLEHEAKFLERGYT